MRTNNVVVLFLAIVMGGIAAFMARHWLESHAVTSASGQGVGTIVVAAQSLRFGAALTADDVMEIPWASKALPEGAFVSKDELFKDGRRIVLSALDRNEPVLKSKITGPGQRGSLSSLIEPGKRAVTVRVDDVRGVAGFILPGDFVDVVLIGEDAAARRENYSDILLHHVKVLAIDQLASERQEQPTVAKAVTVEVTPEQAQKILLATNIGKLSLVLRQPVDDNAGSDQRVTERDLGRGRTTEPARKVVLAPAPAAPPAPPAPAAAKPSNTVTVSIVRGTKREDYNVKRSPD